MQTSFENSFRYLDEVELRRLHQRFSHPSAHRLYQLLKHVGDEPNHKVLDYLRKFCVHCKKYAKLPGRFKSTLRQDVIFNHSVIFDVMYLNNYPILHVVDEATRLQAARSLKNLLAQNTWDATKLCWIDTYLNPDYIVHDAGTNFTSRELRHHDSSMDIITKSGPVEAYWSIRIFERYHSTLRRAYKVI